MRGSQPWRTNRSRVLRSHAVSAEQRLWFALRNRALCGFKFIRQAPVGPYYADFLCRDEKLIVEVDGATHGEAAEIASDLRRAAHLERLGYRIVRVTNEDVRTNLYGVLDMLLAILEKRA